jgi:2-iminobutanoate/2-iminopropanoate deaminase
MRQILHTTEAPTYDTLPISQGVATETLVFVAGMALDEHKRTRMAEAVTIADETRICLDAIDRVLQEAGCTIKDVVKTTCYVSDDSYRTEFSKAYAEYWEAGQYPLRCTFVVGIGGNCRVEIDAVAVRPGN